MVKHTRRHRGGGVQTPQQFFNPTAYAPAAGLFSNVPTTAPNAYEIRPVLQSTFQAVGGRSLRRSRQERKPTRRAHGGFSPSVMGGFVANAQAAIVPMALYAVYHTLVPKNKKASGGKTRRYFRRG